MKTVTSLIILILNLLISGCEKLDPSPTDYSGTVIDNKSGVPLNDVYVKLTYERDLIIASYEELIDQTNTDGNGRFYLHDPHKKGEKLVIEKDGYFGVSLELESENEFSIELYRYAELYIFPTITPSVTEPFSFTIVSTDKVIYEHYPERVSHSYTYNTQNFVPELLKINTYSNCNYDLTAKYGILENNAVISFKNRDTLFYCINLKDGALSVTDLSLVDLNPMIDHLRFSTLDCSGSNISWRILDTANSKYYPITGIVWSERPSPTIKTNDGWDFGLESGGYYYAFIDEFPCNFFIRPYVVTINKTVFYGEEVPITSSDFIQFIYTLPQINLTRNSADFCAIMENCNCNPILSKGYYWGENPNPTLNDNVIIVPFDQNPLQHFTNLLPNKTYYIKPFAIQGGGTTYGKEISFTVPADSISDIDGNIYDIVKIGEQWWMAENLKTTHYADGSSINRYKDRNIVTDTASYCSYNFDQNNISDYGLLYNWHVITNSGKICPAGWHVPSNWDWNSLLNFIDNLSPGIPYRELKEAFNLHWIDTSWSVKDSLRNITGFSARGAGAFYLANNGIRSFYNLKYGAYFWSSTDISNSYLANYIAMQGNRYGNGEEYIFRDFCSKNYFFSIRCVKD